MPLLSALSMLPTLLRGCALLAGGRDPLRALHPMGGRRWRRLPVRPPRTARDAGMSTAEYAVGTVAAVAFAGVLYAVVTSSATRYLITSVVDRALALPF
jgi:hypothetical protein